MGDAEVIPMHDDFPRWYREINLKDEPEGREARWAGISALVKTTGSKEVEALIRLAFKTRQPPTAQQIQGFRQTFRDADVNFDMQGNDRELQVLAGASLAALMSQDRTAAAKAALGITTAALGGARKPSLPVDLRILAETAIDRLAENNRKRPKLAAHTRTEAPKFDFEAAAAKVREQPNWEGVALAFGAAAEGARSAFGMMAQRQAKAVNAMDAFIKVQDEELQMLWWLIGQRSEDFDCAFDAVPADAQALVFAKELADHTEVLPGPASLKGLLSRAGLKERKKLTIPAAVNAGDQEWFKSFVSDDEPSPVTTPIHYAIKRKLETGDNESWVAGWAAAVGIAPTLAVSPLALGVLFYHESLLFLFSAE